MVFIIATRNRHKTDEIRAILGSEHCFLTLADFPEAPRVVEDAPDFAGNARKKALELARWLQSHARARSPLPNNQPCAVLADDSGLEVDALQGAPGVHSARFAALVDDPGQTGNAPDAANNAKLLRLLQSVPETERTARFRCVIALVRVGQPENSQEVPLFEGACTGRIGHAPRGEGGFGYDPLFVPSGYEESFAQLGETIKNQLSHRSRALLKLKEFLERSKGR